MSWLGLLCESWWLGVLSTTSVWLFTVLSLIRCRKLARWPKMTVWLVPENNFSYPPCWIGTFETNTTGIYTKFWLDLYIGLIISPKQLWFALGWSSCNFTCYLTSKIAKHHNCPDVVGKYLGKYWESNHSRVISVLLTTSRNDLCDKNGGFENFLLVAFY